MNTLFQLVGKATFPINLKNNVLQIIFIFYFITAGISVKKYGNVLVLFYVNNNTLSLQETLYQRHLSHCWKLNTEIQYVAFWSSISVPLQRDVISERQHGCSVAAEHLEQSSDRPKWKDLLFLAEWKD